MTIAPPTPSPTSAGRADGAASVYRLYGLVRDIRVETQNISRSLAPVRAALALTDPDAQAAELSRAIAEARDVVLENASIVADRFVALRDLVNTDPVIYDSAGDAVTELENQWREVLRAVDLPDKPTVTEIGRRLERVDTHLQGLEWQAALVTIPNRVRQHLGTKRVGGRLRFHEAFRDEIEDEGQRVNLLLYLREHAASFSGVVDVPSGVIYRIAAHAWRRVLSWVVIVGLATAGAYGFVWFITYGVEAIELDLSDIPGLGRDRFPELMSAYWGLLVGATAHIVIEAVKVGQRSDSTSFQALEDWFLWGHVREQALIVGVVSLYAILVGLALVSPAPASITLVAALGAGYSADSILGLFISRFDSFAKAAVPGAVTKP